MKRQFISFLLFLLPVTSLGQDEEWLFYDFDSLVSIEMPGVVYEWDTIMNEIYIYQIVSNIGNSYFTVQKTVKQYQSEEELLKNLPHDEKSLDKTYKDFIKGVLNKSPYTVKSEYAISLNDFKGYKLLLQDHNELTVTDLRVFLLNKEYYSFTYFNNTDFNHTEKNYFFNSIYLNENAEISQYLGKDNSGDVAGALGELTAYLIIAIGIILAVRAAIRRKK
jgi:hypothetical protein